MQTVKGIYLIFKNNFHFCLFFFKSQPTLHHLATNVESYHFRMTQARKVMIVLLSQKFTYLIEFCLITHMCR